MTITSNALVSRSARQPLPAGRSLRENREAETVSEYIPARSHSRLAQVSRTAVSCSAMERSLPLLWRV